MRAAVYDGMSLAERRRLHGAAAARLPATGERLRHRLMASTAPDAGIARELEVHAATLHERQAQQPLAGTGDVWGFESELGVDRASLVGSADGLVRLAWRGSAHALTGSSQFAIDDLSLLVARIGEGTVDFGDGVMHSLLGFAQWTAGERRRSVAHAGRGADFVGQLRVLSSTSRPTGLPRAAPLRESCIRPVPVLRKGGRGIL